MNTAKQNGTKDCGLFAIAAIVSLAFGEDPTKFKYNQDQMRVHLVKSFESNKLLVFPKEKKRKYAAREDKEVEIEIFCVCRLPDDGEVMVHCEKCGDWYHEDCIQDCIDKQSWRKPDKKIDWYCGFCQTPVKNEDTVQ